VIAASMDGNLYALHGRTGGLLWSADVGAPISASLLLLPPPEGDTVVVGDLDGTLHAFDASGNRLWATRLDGPISAWAAFLGPPEDGSVPGPRPMQLDPGERIYVGTETGTLYSLNPNDGSIAFAVSLDGPIASSPVVIRGFASSDDPPKVFVGTTAGTLYSLFADDGTEVWSLGLGGAITGTPAVGSPRAIGDPNIFVGDEAGTVSAIGEVDGRPTPQWTVTLGAAVHTSPALANGVLYVGANDSQLHALDALSGRELFSSDPITMTRSSPLIADGMVVVGTTHGEIVTFGLPT
jgi:eukaryotic-like serine/threonine-protein kinase